MKILKKISLAYALQVSAIVFIFGYPECVSSVKKIGDKTSVIRKEKSGTLISEAGIQKLADSSVVSKSLQSVVTNFTSSLHAGK